jgi:hypothetical protein
MGLGVAAGVAASPPAAAPAPPPAAAPLPPAAAAAEAPGSPFSGSHGVARFACLLLLLLLAAEEGAEGGGGGGGAIGSLAFAAGGPSRIARLHPASGAGSGAGGGAAGDDGYGSADCLFFAAGASYRSKPRQGVVAEASLEAAPMQDLAVASQLAFLDQLEARHGHRCDISVSTFTGVEELDTRLREAYAATGLRVRRFEARVQPAALSAMMLSAFSAALGRPSESIVPGQPAPPANGSDAPPRYKFAVYMRVDVLLRPFFDDVFNPTWTQTRFSNIEWFDPPGGWDRTAVGSYVSCGAARRGAAWRARGRAGGQECCARARASSRARICSQARTRARKQGMPPPDPPPFAAPRRPAHRTRARCILPFSAGLEHVAPAHRRHALLRPAVPLCHRADGRNSARGMAQLARARRAAQRGRGHAAHLPRRRHGKGLRVRGACARGRAGAVLTLTC